MDGAHNPEGVSALRSYVEAEWRRGERLTWMVGMTDSRDPLLARRT